MSSGTLGGNTPMSAVCDLGSFLVPDALGEFKIGESVWSSPDSAAEASESVVAPRTRTGVQVHTYFDVDGSGYLSLRPGDYVYVLHVGDSEVDHGWLYGGLVYSDDLEEGWFPSSILKKKYQ